MLKHRVLTKLQVAVSSVCGIRKHNPFIKSAFSSFLQQEYYKWECYSYLSTQQLYEDTTFLSV